MIKKVFGLLLINFSVLMAFDSSKILQEKVELSFGEEWVQENRAKGSLAAHCPLATESNKTYCFIDEFTFEDGKIKYNSIYTTKNIQESNSDTRNKRGSSSANINLYELLDPSFMGTQNDPKDSNEESNNANAQNLMRIIKNAKGDNKYIFPLYVKSVKGFLYENSNNDPKPFIGFAGLKVDSYNSNPYIKALGLQGTNRNEQITSSDGVKSSIQFTDLVSTGTKSNISKDFNNSNFIADFGSIGDQLGKWLEDDTQTGSAKDSTLLRDLKEKFSITANDNSQTWSRIMAGVMVLDDAYVQGLNFDGEIDLRDGNGVVPNKDDNIFKNSTDGKLWGYYLYLSQNLHQLEILLILALAGGSFTFITGWKGFNYFRQIKTEQKEPLDWKKMILQPITYTLLVATPLIPSKTTLYSDYIIDASPIVTDVEINRLNLNGVNSSQENYDENLFYQTPLQVAIQGAVGFGSAIADEFSKSLTYSFALFLSFRENVMDDNSIMLTNLKKDYNEISKDLITLNAYQNMYASTCKYDYDYLNANVKLGILPNNITLNALSENELRTRYNEHLDKFINLNKEKSSYGFLSYQACQKIETYLNKNSVPLLNRIYKYSSDFTQLWRIYDLNGGIISVDQEKQNDLRKKLFLLADYEKEYGWVNVAMIPLLYQVMYPTFNPYYYSEKTNSLGNSPISSNNNDILKTNIDLSKYYTLIGTPTSSDGQIIENMSDDENEMTIDTSKSSIKDSNPANSLLSYVVSMVSYSFLPGYNSIEQQVKSLNDLFLQKDDNGKPIEKGNFFTRFLTLSLGLLGNASLGDDGDNQKIRLWSAFGASTFFSQDIVQELVNGAIKTTGLDKLDLTSDKILAFSDALLIKMASQSLYLYILNLMVMVILTMILVFKIGMFFLQVIIFYMASPLVIIWAMITKKEEQVKNYISKASTLIFAPILITLSGTILIVGIGIIHNIYYIIVNHIMKIQIESGVTIGKSLADYIQLQAFFGIGNILLGFGYLLLGYVILIKFSHWFFETVGIQTQNSVTQSLESLTHRMRFGQGLGM